MTALLALVLVCAADVPAEACSRETAIDVLVSPANSPMECLITGQSLAASAGLLGAPNRYLKIACERRRSVVEIEPR